MAVSIITVHEELGNMRGHTQIVANMAQFFSNFRFTGLIYPSNHIEASWMSAVRKLPRGSAARAILKNWTGDEELQQLVEPIVAHAMGPMFRG